MTMSPNPSTEDYTTSAAVTSPPRPGPPAVISPEMNLAAEPSATASSTSTETSLPQFPIPSGHRITSNITKFPSQRQIPFQNAVEWLMARRADDNIGPYWRIHDKLYDFTMFAKRHPGGSEWITMSRGTDITEAFEASHILNFSSIVGKILPKYYVKEALAPRTNQLYTFEPNGFYAVLRSRVEPILHRVGTGPSNLVIRIQDTLALLFVTLALWSTLTNSIPLQIVTGFVLGMTVICGHNFFHIKDNWRKFYFDLSMLSSFEWRISHALSHHMYPNTILDFEIYMLEPFLEVCPGIKRNLAQKYLVHVLIYFSYFVNFGMELLKRIRNVYWTQTQRLRPENCIVLVQLILLIVIAPNIMVGIHSWLIIHACASFYFGFIGLTAAHHHPLAFHEGDEFRPAPDFGLCQLDATKNHAEPFARSNLLYIVSTFGEHPLHHLFPTVCHSKLKYLQSVVEKTLAEFNEHHESLSQKQLVIGLHQQLVRETPNLFRKHVERSK